MASISRRNLVWGSLALAAAAPAAAIVLRDGFLHDVRSILRAHFGSEVADHPDALAFAADFATHARQGAGFVQDQLAQAYFDLGLNAIRPAALFEDRVVGAFLVSTNVVLHLEDGRPFAYAGPVDRRTPCGNMLSAMQLQHP